jgi:diguanylate cyclase
MQQYSLVIVIDDDPMIRLLVGKALQAVGLSVLEAASGEEGLRVFNENGADAVLLDVMMPSGMDGYATCAALRSHETGQHIPVLMMTGREDLESINQAYEVGATDFITKPINIPLLGHRVRYMLRASHTTRQLSESQRSLHRLAYFDSLTELPNRQFFREHLQRMISLAQRQHFKMAVLFLDLDGFKNINDTLGHHIGDMVLKTTGERLRNSIRASDMFTRTGTTEEGVSLARLGGDEFTVILSVIERSEDAASVAERIRVSLNQPFSYDQHEIFTTTSIGIAIFPDDGDTAEELLKNADISMYHSKHGGGNQYSYFSPNMTEKALRRLALEKHLRKAIERDELELYYQPLFDVSLGRFNAMEALLRWNNCELGWISPAEFIPLAEDTGLIISIGELVLRKACNQLQIWQSMGLSIKRIAVNVSAIQFLHKGFSVLLAHVLADTKINPANLELELTESTLINDETSVLSVLQTLNHIGVQLGIDDFGTGYSSLSRLKNFPIDRLKIDQVFVQNLEHDASCRAIVTAIIAMAKSMNMEVTAEGVETEAQLNHLKQTGCNEFQGYFLSRPLSSAQAEAFFVKQLQAKNSI